MFRLNLIDLFLLFLSRIEFGSMPSSTKTVIIFPQTRLLQFSIFTIDPEVSQYPKIPSSEDM